MLENNRGMNFSKGLQMLCCSEVLMNDPFTPMLDMGLSEATCGLQYCTTYLFSFISVILCIFVFVGVIFTSSAVAAHLFLRALFFFHYSGGGHSHSHDHEGHGHAHAHEHAHAHSMEDLSVGLSILCECTLQMHVL
jgi:hypothetical protein